MDNWISFQGIFRLWPETLDKAVFENVWMDVWPLYGHLYGADYDSSVMRLQYRSAGHTRLLTAPDQIVCYSFDA